MLHPCSLTRLRPARRSTLEFFEALPCPLEDKAGLQKIPGLSDELAGGVLNYMDVASSTFRVLSTGNVGSSQETIECIVQRKDDGFTVLRWVWL